MKIEKTPRQLRTEQVKASIIQATMNIIREYGMEYVTVSNVCKAASVSVGSFYHHFGGKEELLAQYLEEAFRRCSDSFEEITGHDVIENILQYYAFYNKFLLEQGFEFIRNFYTNTNKGLYCHRNYLLGSKSYGPMIETIDHILQQAKNDGYLTEDCNIEQLIYDLSILEKGILFDWCLCDGEYDLIEQATRIIKNYLLHSLVNDRYLKEYAEADKTAI